MKTKKSFLAAALMLLCATIVKAQMGSTTIDGITYDCWDGSTARVISCDTTLTHAKVESNVTINGYVYPVTTIGSQAFGVSRWDGKSNNNLKSVELPSGIHTIDSYAFYRCTALESIDLPSALTYIGEYAFYETSILSMELPASVASIGYNAFSNSTGRLTCCSTTPPTLLPSSEYNYSPTLNNISIVYVPQGCYYAYKNVDPWASKVIMEDGRVVKVTVTVTPGMLGEEILNHPDANYLSDVNHLIIKGSLNDADISNIQNSMPNLLAIDLADVDMKSLPSNMFFNRRALLSIILPKNVETIGGGAFFGCINLEAIVLPEGAKTIAGYSYGYNDYGGCYGTFGSCTSLKAVTFPSTLETIGSYAFSGCTALREVSFKDGLRGIGENAFSGCNRISKIEFSEGLTYISNYAFQNCDLIQNVTFPKSLTDLSYGAFAYCAKLTNVTFLGGIKTIGYEYEGDNYSSYSGAFQGCTSLLQVTLPNGLEKIYQNTFSGCNKLTNITIPEGVTFIGRNAFSGCSSLKSVELPSTLVSCGRTPFSGCNKLNDVRCLALFPPTLSDGLLTLDDMGLALKRTLNVPEWTLNRYKLTSGWAAFSEILPINGIYPSTISVIGDAVLTLPAAGLPATYKPNMAFPTWYDYQYATAYGNISSLHLKGTGTLPLTNFNMDCGYNAMMKQLLNEATITADKVMVSMNLESQYYGDGYTNQTQWHFLSFPFDVKVSDIATNCDWVVRKYDGVARAKCDYNNTWVTVPYDGTLNADQGYIWACTGGSFTLPAIDNANKNLIFANTKRDVALQEYASEFVSNSSWNLVGNPFPCYYNTNEMDYTAPITVWENNTYAAYSPVDDSYVLRPFEAFFVQCPAGVKSIGFKPEGRQLQSTSTTPATSPSRMQAKAERKVINLVLSNANSADRTRIVINNDAKMDYELTCDAAKFMSDDTNVPQIFSVSNGEIFAINERPMGNGIVKLGTHFGMAGTYTIAMQSASNMMVVLVDHKTGIEIDLTAGDYTFSAEAGDSDRFEVRMFADEETTAIDAVAADTKVVAISNAIVVTTSTDADVELYNAAGSLMAVGQGKSMTFDAAQGMYIVKVNGVSHKVTVVK